MPQWLAILIIVALVIAMIALGSIPIWQHWESTPARRALTWAGLIGMGVVGVAIVAFILATS